MARTISVALVFAVLFVTDAMNTSDVSMDTYDKIADCHVRAAVGETVQLRCHVPDLDLSQDEVYWVQQETGRKITRLSKSWYGFHYHARCSVYTDDCVLEISHARKDDTGVYQCVVDRNPPIRILVNLSVVDPETTIVGAPVRVHRPTSAINLTCVVAPRPAWKVTFLWMHDGQEVGHSTDGRHVITSSESNNSIRSHLFIKDAQPMDSGTYTCKPSEGNNDSVEVHVKQVVPDDFHHTISGSKRTLAVVSATGLLVLAAVAATFSNHYY